MKTIDQQCAEADARVTEWINRSAGQHRRAMNAPIVRTDEQQYAQPLHGYTDLDQRNSDGTSPHDDARDTVEIAMDFALVVLALGSLTFVLFALAGFVWGKS